MAEDLGSTKQDSQRVQVAARGPDRSRGSPSRAGSGGLFRPRWPEHHL